MLKDSELLDLAKEWEFLEEHVQGALVAELQQRGLTLADAVELTVARDAEIVKEEESRIDTLHSLIRENCEKGLVQVGVRRFSTQRALTHKLVEMGYWPRPLLQNPRQFIRDIVTRENAAFVVLAPYICIHTVHKGRELFWNGLGVRTDADHFNGAEVFYDLQGNNAPFRGILPGLD